MRFFPTITAFRWCLVNSLLALMLLGGCSVDRAGNFPSKPENTDSAAKRITLPQDLACLFDRQQAELLRIMPSSLTHAAHRLRIKRHDEIHDTLVTSLLDFEKSESLFSVSFPIRESRFGFLEVKRKRDGGSEGERHDDQLLCALAESGVDLTAEIRLKERDAQVDELLFGCKQSITKKQELEWSIVSLFSYGTPAGDWSNRFGETYSLDSLVRHLIDQPPGDCACFGAHRLYALAFAVKSNNERKLLKDSTRRKAIAILKKSASFVLANQCDDGFMPPVTEMYDSNSDVTGSASINTKISIVGHHLEWLHLATESIGLDADNRVRKAIIFVIVNLDSVEIGEDNYPGTTHAINGVGLWL